MCSKRLAILELLLMHIRNESAADAAAVYDINARAFGRPAEAELAVRLRTSDALVLSLVAEAEGKLLAHVIFTHGVLRTPAGTHAALALGPVAVAPENQRQGIGAQLIRHGLAECAALGHALVFLLGHTNYYPRLGFSPAVARGVRWERDTSGGPCVPFMVYELIPGALTRTLDGQQGMFAFAGEFDD
jgi:putative acetyltransferase